MEINLKFIFIIFVLIFPIKASAVSNCMQDIVAVAEVCIQNGSNPSIPDPNAQPAMNVDISVSIKVSFFICCPIILKFKLITVYCHEKYLYHNIYE